MSDPASRDSNIRERKRSLAWITAASATYLELGLPAEQRICLYRESLAVAQEHSDAKLIVLCTSALTTLDDHTMNDFRKSKKAGCKNKEDDITKYMLLVAVHFKKEEYADAILYSKKLLPIAQKSGDKVAMTTAYMMLGYAHLEKEKYDDAITYSKNLLAIAEESGDKMNEMNAYKTLVNAHIKKEEYDDAILYSKKLLAIAQESGDKVSEMYAYKKLGDAHLEKKEYDDAISYSKKCLAIAQESGDEVAEMKTYNSLVDAHLKKKEYDDAILYSTKRLAIARASADKTTEMNAYVKLGEAHMEKEEYDDAISYSKKLLAIAQESRNKVHEMNAYMIFGASHLKKEECDDAILYSKKCLAIAQESGDKVHEMNAYMMLGKAHLKKEEYDDVISYSKECLAIAQKNGNKVAEMNACEKLGDAHFKKKEYDDAILISEKRLDIAQESGDKVAEMHAYEKLGNAYLRKGKYDDAILYSKKCLTIAQESGHEMNEMTAYILLGGALLEKEKYDDAISYSKKCLAIAQKSDHKVAEMHAYEKLADAHLRKEKYDDAILYSKTLLAIARESVDKVHQMNAYMKLGYAHLKKEKYDDVISYSTKLLDIAHESGDEVRQIAASKMLGDAHLKKEEYDDAISYSTKLLAIAQESGDKVAEMIAYNTLKDANFDKKEYDEAISYSTKCLAIAQKSGNQVAEMDAYITLGVAHLKKKKYDDAISYSTKFLAIAQESRDKVAEMNAYMMLGVSHLDKEEYDDAHCFFTEGMTIARELGNNHKVNNFGLRIYGIHQTVGTFEGNELLSDEELVKQFLQSIPKNESFYHSFLGYINHKANCNYEEAISCLEDFMALGENSINKDEYHGQLWTCKHAISELHVLLKDYDKGIQYQQEALNVAREESSKSRQAKSHFSLGEVYYKLKQFENAEKSFEESLKCYELIFVGLKQNDRFKIAFVDQYKETFKMLLKVLIETNKKEEALSLSDHYRAKALKDLLVSSYGMKKEQTADEVIQKADVQSLVFKRNYTLLFFSTCFDKLYTFAVEAGNELGFSVQHLEYCDTCLNKLVDKTFEDMKVHQVENCEDRSLDVMHYSEENKNPIEDELTQLLIQEIEKRLSEQCCVCRGNSSKNCDESSLTNGLKILNQKLISNIKCLIKQDEMVIIPEGPLCRLPFAALRDPDTGQYLVETKRIRMAPSMASLKLLQEYPAEHHSRKEALIIGAAVLGPVMLDGVEKVFTYLEGAIEEADEIAIMLGVRPLLSACATKPDVMRRLQEGASVVHIAAHGSLEKATIVLAPSPKIRETKIPVEEDYMLTMADVQQAQVRAQLVVLSCCHSGRGEIKAEGVVGMCRAFLASGARAVVGSLWAIDDDATSMFMETFYSYLKDGKSASTSLNLTMNDMRRTPEYSEPKYWAPFFLMGDDVKIQFKD